MALLTCPRAPNISAFSHLHSTPSIASPSAHTPSLLPCSPTPSTLRALVFRPAQRLPLPSLTLSASPNDVPLLALPLFGCTDGPLHDGNFVRGPTSAPHPPPLVSLPAVRPKRVPPPQMSTSWEGRTAARLSWSVLETRFRHRSLQIVVGVEYLVLSGGCGVDKGRVREAEERGGEVGRGRRERRWLWEKILRFRSQILCVPSTERASVENGAFRVLGWRGESRVPVRSVG
ncbi:hypothetical protein FA13DRAFT_364450 [Coprinellus micaceus]|uniref:Uncharacterized protein n=1 Tax=Coprinellus micaceus TaxID=71717 RepID=A0A4Y7TBT4_COPMI|nr:hypothetical protein FA13DRAFT_364450 [Coprinellus micaceus]